MIFQRETVGTSLPLLPGGTHMQSDVNLKGMDGASKPFPRVEQVEAHANLDNYTYS